MEINFPLVVDSVSVGNVVCFTSRIASEEASRLIHDPIESDVQEANVVLEESVPPILSDSADSRVAEMVDAPVMDVKVQLVMVVDDAL